MAAAGGFAEFKVLVKNPGNGNDSYSLSVKNDSFPQGTVFSFWDEKGSLPLLNNSTATIAKGEYNFITIKAQLPAGKEKNEVSSAVFTATSVGDSSKTAAVNLELKKIIGASIDLAYSAKTYPDEKGTDKDGYKDAGASIPNNKVLPGKTTTYKLFVHNESGAPRAFKLSAHTHVTGDGRGSYVGGQLENGWTVRYKKAGTGQFITSTPVLPDEGIFEVEVDLTIPADQVAANYEFAVMATDGIVNDAIRYHVTVEESGKLSLTPDGANQIEPGGAVFYNHRLVNNSNKSRAIQVFGTNSLDGWQHVFSSEDKTVEITPEYLTVILHPNQAIDFKVKVLAPANALQGSMDILNLNAQEVEMENGKVKKANGKPVAIAKGLEAKATDSTTVIKGQVRLRKQVKMLSGESKDENTILQEARDLDSDAFKVDSTEKVVPDQDYVVWQIVATNQGDAPAKQVTIRDAAPAFTTLVANSAYVVGGDSKGKVVSGSAGTEVVFNVGENAENADGKGGTLKPGESVEVRFTVKVN